jgi:hypothetical protein
MPNDLDHNPFRPIAAENLCDSGQRVKVDFVPIIYRWEKMRLVYNAVLISFTLFWSYFVSPQLMFDPLFMFQLCVGGIVTNLCFFTGPAIEGYGRYLGFWHLGLSVTLFVIGLTFSVLLTLGFLIVRAR